MLYHGAIAGAESCVYFNSLGGDTRNGKHYIRCYDVISQAINYDRCDTCVIKEISTYKQQAITGALLHSFYIPGFDMLGIWGTELS